MQQNPYALICNLMTKYAPLRVTLGSLWKKLSNAQAIWGSSELMIPTHQTTGNVTVDRSAVNFSEMETVFNRYPIRELIDGKRVDQRSYFEFAAAAHRHMGLSPFHAGMIDIGVNLSKALERWTYVGDYGKNVDLQSVRGFLNNPNTTRVRSTTSVKDMSGLDFYNLIKDAHSQLIQNIGNAQLYEANGGSISIAIPAIYHSKLQDVVTLPLSDTPISMKVYNLIMSLPGVEKLNIVEPRHVAAVTGTKTNDGLNASFDSNELCIFIGFNNPSLCGVAVDQLDSNENYEKIQRLLDESNRFARENEVTVFDEIKNKIKDYSIDTTYVSSGDIDEAILKSLGAIASSYEGIEPANILSYRFDGWHYQHISGAGFGWLSSGSIFTAGGIVTVPGMMIAMGTKDTL